MDGQAQIELILRGIATATTQQNSGGKSRQERAVMSHYRLTLARGIHMSPTIALRYVRM